MIKGLEEFIEHTDSYLKWFGSKTIIERFMTEGGIFHFHLIPGLQEIVENHKEFIHFDRLLFFYDNDLSSGKLLRTLILGFEDKILLLRRRSTLVLANFRVNYEIVLGTQDDLKLNFKRFDRTGWFSDELKDSYYIGNYRFKDIKPYSNEVSIDVFNYERFINQLTHPWWEKPPITF